MTRRTLLVAITLLSVTAVVALSAGVVPAADGDGAGRPAVGHSANLSAPVATAFPPTPGATSVHEVVAGTSTTPETVDAGAAGRVSTLHLRYPAGANVSLSDVDAEDVRPFVVRQTGTTVAGRERLEAADVTVGDRTVTVRLAGDPTLDADDSVGLRVADVRNPPAATTVPVSLRIGTGERNRTTPPAEIEVRRRPAPEVGRFVSWPAGVDGFLVVEEEGGRRNVTAYDPATDVEFGVDLPRCDPGDSGGTTQSVTAHRDVDGDGRFDPGIDRPFRRDGRAVSSSTTLYCTATTTTTRAGTTETGGDETATTAGPTAGTTGDAASGPDDGGPLAGDVGPAAVFGLCVALLAAVLVVRRLRPRR